MCVRLNERMFFCVSLCVFMCVCVHVANCVCVRVCMFVHVCVWVCLSCGIPSVCVKSGLSGCVHVRMCACAHKCARPRECEGGAVCVCDVAHVDMGKRAHVCAPLHVPVCAVECGMVCARGDTRNICRTRSFSPLVSLGTSAPWKNDLFRLPSSPDFLSLGSFRLDLRIY
jgi:hypothetical protein